MQRHRIPRWMRGIPGLRYFLPQSHPQPPTTAPAPVAPAAEVPSAPPPPDAPSIDALIAAQRYDEAVVRAQASIGGSPSDRYSWQMLGTALYERDTPDAWPTRQAVEPPVAEDAAMLRLLAAVPTAAPALSDTLPDDQAVAALRRAAEALLAENTELARRLEPLRRQWGYRVDGFETVTRYHHTREYMRTLSLMMHKFGVVPVSAAAPTIPPALEDGFTMGGRVPVEPGHLNAAYPPTCIDIYTDRDIENFKRAWRDEALPDPGDHQAKVAYKLMLDGTDPALRRALQARLGAGAAVAVVGSRAPVYEALCLTLGATPTMVHRGPVENRTAEVKSARLDETPAQRYDAVIAVHVVEQAGLGMHGEPLDPNGDLALMGRLKQLVKPGGLLFLVVPTGDDVLVFNVARIYGALRLPRLLDGWTLLEQDRFTNPWLHGGNEARSLLVLAAAA